MSAEATARAVEGAAEAADDWKSTWRLVDRRGDDAICVRVRHDGLREFVLASGYDDRTGRWGSGEYFDSLASAAAKLENRAISNSDEVIGTHVRLGRTRLPDRRWGPGREVADG